MTHAFKILAKIITKKIIMNAFTIDQKYSGSETLMTATLCQMLVSHFWVCIDHSMMGCF